MEKLKCALVSVLGCWLAGAALLLAGGTPLAAGAAVEEDAVERLRSSMAYLADLKTFGLETHSTLEAVLHSGQKIQFDTAVYVTVQRPDKMHARRLGDLVEQLRRRESPSVGDGRVESGHDEAVNRFWRVGEWHGDNTHAHRGVAQQAPDGGTPDGCCVHEAGLVGAGRAGGEAVDAVLPGVHASHEGGPCLGSDGMYRGLENAPAATRHEAGEYGQLPLLDPGENHIESGSVETDDQDTRAFWKTGTTASPRIQSVTAASR